MIHLLKQTIMDKRKYQQMLLPLLLMVLVLVGGGACSDDEEPVQENKYDIIELNMDDHRFENSSTINILVDAEFQSVPESFGFITRNDSLFIEYFGSLLYPTRLPADFRALGNPFILSGIIKQKPEGADYYPLILEEFK